MVLEDGLSEDEAIATALANNAAFRATLAQLEMAQGDVIQSRLLANPNLVALFPVSVKQLEWVLYLPVDAMLLRPHRTEIAQCDCRRIVFQVVQSGLNLVRDVRVAYADLALAGEQAQLAEEGVEIRQGIADLTRRRLERGEISELESTTAQIDALNARANAALLQQNVVVARSRLATLIGLPFDESRLFIESLEPPSTSEFDVVDLTEQAIASRPDLQSADWSVAAAARRTRLSRWLFLRADLAADANGRGQKGFEAGPGIRVDLPILNRNQGGIVRADAEWQAALRGRDATRDQIVQDVHVAAAQVRQSQENLAILEDRLVPSMRETLTLAGKAFEDGGAPYLLVLQSASQYLDARSRALDQVAALRAPGPSWNALSAGRLPERSRRLRRLLRSQRS